MATAELERNREKEIRGSRWQICCCFQLTRIVTAVEFVGHVRKTVDPFVAAPRQRYALAVIASPLVRRTLLLGVIFDLIERDFLSIGLRLETTIFCFFLFFSSFFFYSLPRSRTDRAVDKCKLLKKSYRNCFRRWRLGIRERHCKWMTAVHRPCPRRIEIVRLDNDLASDGRLVLLARAWSRLTGRRKKRKLIYRGRIADKS